MAWIEMNFNCKEIPYKIIMKADKEKEILTFEGETQSAEIFPTEEYSIHYTFDEIKKKFKIFSGYDNIKQVYDEIEDSYKSKELELSKESNNLFLKLPLQFKTFKECIFELVKKPFNSERAISDLNSIRLGNISEMYFKINQLENTLKSILNDHKNEIEKLKVDYNSQNTRIESLTKELKKSNKIIDENDKEIKRLNKELNNLKYNTNKEIKNLNIEINDLKGQIKEIGKKNEDMKSKLNEELKHKYDDIKNENDILETKFCFLKDINIEELKNKYKDFEYFKDVMNKYYNNIAIINNSFFFIRESWYKSSYKFIVDFIFEELIEKNGKDCNKIVEFDIKSYESFTQAEYNAFFLKNAIHQLFYSKYYGSYECIFNDIYDKIIELFPKIKEYNKDKLLKAKYDIMGYNNTFKIYNIIKLFKS